MSGPHVAARARVPRRRRRGVGPAADDERLDADRGGDARPRLPASAVKAVPILARTAGLLAHLAEEQRAPDRLPDGRRRRRRRSEYEPADVMLEPEVETRPWAEQLALDDARYRAQLAYLLERSPLLPREAGEAGFDARRPADSPTSRSCRSPRSRSSGRPARRENPFGAHLCAAPDEIVRIYSTSGTTGRAELHPAHGGRSRELGHRLGAQLRGLGRRRPGERIVSTYNAGPFVGRRGARGVRPASASATSRSGTGNTERLLLAIELLQPEAAVLTPSYAAYLVEWAAERGFDLRGSSVQRVLVAGEPGGGEPAFRARLEEGWGAQRDRGDGDRRHRRVALGRVRGAGRDAPRRARLRPRRADRPRDAARRSRSRTAPPASSCSPTCATAPRRCCGSARATTSRSGRQRRARAGARARGSAASGGPTTC